MTTKPAHDRPILVTGAGGAIGGIGRNVTMSLLAKGYKLWLFRKTDDDGLGTGTHRARVGHVDETAGL